MRNTLLVLTIAAATLLALAVAGLVAATLHLDPRQGPRAHYFGAFGIVLPVFVMAIGLCVGMFGRGPVAGPAIMSSLPLALLACLAHSWRIPGLLWGALYVLVAHAVAVLVSAQKARGRATP